MHAVLIPSALFALGHAVQLLEGMSAAANLLQVTNAFAFGALYGTLRLRVHRIWPLVLGRAFFDCVAAITELYGPFAIYSLTEIPAGMRLP